MHQQYHVRNRFILIGDIGAISIGAWGAFALRFDWMFQMERDEFNYYLTLALVLKIAVFFAFGLYQRFWRYASLWDLLAVVVANATAMILLVAAMVSLRLLEVIAALPRSVFPIDFVLCTASTIGLRSAIRILAETSFPRDARAVTRRNVLIAGAGDAGTLCVRELQKNPALRMRPVGFLDDEEAKHGKRIYGVPVLGSLSDLADVVKGRAVDEVIIAMPTTSGAVVRRVVDACAAAHVPSRVMPGYFELLGGRVDTTRLRRVEIGDLLRREQLLGERDHGEYLRGRRVLVTGAGGSIGSELCRQVAYYAPNLLVMLGHGENSIFETAAEIGASFPQVPIQAVIADIRDRDRIQRVFAAARPDIVFHAAAHKHVPLMEDNPEEAVTNNVVGTRNTVEAAAAVGTPRFVLISTDKAVAPSSLMGATKRMAELIVRDVAGREGREYVVVRFGNVLGSRGSVVPIFKSQIERGGPITITHPDVQRYFMTIPEAVHLVIQSATIGRGGELLVLDMGRPVRIVDLARDMIRLSGLDDNDIPIVFTGLRPGEKLNEELWENGASVRPTEIAHIRVVSEGPALPLLNVDEAIAQLERAATASDRQRLMDLLQTFLPSSTLTAAGISSELIRSGKVVRLN